ELNLANINTDEEKIRLIENYVKQNFQIILNSDDNLSNLDFIFNNKVANDLGITKLLINLFKINNITYEMGITCDRSSKRFEPDFEAYLFLDHYVIYFPKIDKYLAPEEQFLRLGCIPGTWTNNYGLFIKNVKIGDLETGIGKIKFIEPQPHTFTTDIMTIKVNFSLNIAEPEITINKSSTGYYGAAFQPYVHRMDDEQLSNFKTSLAEMINEQITATTITLQNVNPDEIGIKPFIFEFTTTQHPFME